MISANLEDQLAGMYAYDDEDKKPGNNANAPDTDEDDTDDDETDEDDDETDADEEPEDEKFRERLDTEFPLSGGETEEDL